MLTELPPTMVAHGGGGGLFKSLIFQMRVLEDPRFVGGRVYSNTCFPHLQSKPGTLRGKRGLSGVEAPSPRPPNPPPKNKSTGPVDSIPTHFQGPTAERKSGPHAARGLSGLARMRVPADSLGSQWQAIGNQGEATAQPRHKTTWFPTCWTIVVAWGRATDQGHRFAMRPIEGFPHFLVGIC